VTPSADPVALPRIPTVDPTAADRPVVSVTTAPSGYEGEGFPVRRAFVGVDLPTLDPFAHMDQMGEIDYAPGEPKGTPWHPHRGFETVTYMIDGVFRHQGLQRRRRADHRRRHPVDDRRSRLANMVERSRPLSCTDDSPIPTVGAVRHLAGQPGSRIPIEPRDGQRNSSPARLTAAAASGPSNGAMSFAPDGADATSSPASRS